MGVCVVEERDVTLRFLYPNVYLHSLLFSSDIRYPGRVALHDTGELEQAIFFERRITYVNVLSEKLVLRAHRNSQVEDKMISIGDRHTYAAGPYR